DRTARAAGRATGRPVGLRRRPDGRPELSGSGTGRLSSAHGADLTLCAVSDRTVGCDIEEVAARPAPEWAALLGGHAALAHLVARETGEDPDTAATRVWTAVECLQKAGYTGSAPLTLTPARRPGWTVFSSAELRVTTLATTVRGAAAPLVLAILTGGH
ncbi:hypothetical protein, partial [Streptomyces clavuligerus]